MKIHIDLEITPKARRILLATLVPAALLGGGAVAYAQVNNPAASMTNDALIGTALNSLGSAVANLQVQVAALQAADHVARATLNQDGNVMSQTRGWIRGINHVSTGKYVLSFNPGFFAATPTCTITPNSIGAEPGFDCYGATPTSLTCEIGTVHGPLDVGMSLLCAGS